MTVRLSMLEIPCKEKKRSKINEEKEVRVIRSCTNTIQEENVW